ncbi:MAG: hypothetical protein AAF493_24235 [Pseudomonadota bacterium]
MKTLRTLVVAVLSVSVVAANGQEFPDLTPISIVDVCKSEARAAAGDWNNACREIASLDGYLSVEEKQACRQQAQAIYDVVFDQCMDSFFDLSGSVLPRSLLVE